MHIVVSASTHTLSPKEMGELYVAAFMMENWYYGVAMSGKFVATAKASNFGWSNKTYREFARTLLLFQKLLAPKTQKLYRHVSILAPKKPLVAGKTYKLTTGKSPIQSWSTSLDSVTKFYKDVYITNKKKMTARHLHLDLQTTMPASMIGISSEQVKRFYSKAIKDYPKFYAKHAEELRIVMYKPKDMIKQFNALLRRLNTKMISSQKEVICIVNKPLSVKVVNSYGQ